MPISPSDTLRFRLGPRAAFLAIVAIASIYFGLARLGLVLASVHGNVSPVWPATGFAIGALILFGNRCWPGVAAGAFLANLITPITLPTALAIGVGNTLEAVVGASLFTLISSRMGKFREISLPGAFLVAASVAPTLSATAGVTALYLSSAIPAESIGVLWKTWWVGDALGGLIGAPLMISVREWLRTKGTTDRAAVFKLFGIVGLTSAICGLIFARHGGGGFLFGLFPLLLLAVTWHGWVGVQLVALAISAVGISAAFFGTGPFVDGSLNENLIHLQIFLVSIALTALVLPAFIRSRNHTLPFAVMLIGWMLSGWMFASLQESRRNIDETRLDAQIIAMTGNIERRIEHYENALQAGVALFSSSSMVERDEWTAFAGEIRLRQKYPGALGVGVIFIVRPGELAEFVARIRGQNAPAFTVKTVPSGAYPARQHAANDHWIITYLEPADANQAAIGLDIASEGTRAAAAAEARDSGRAIMTSRVQLVQDEIERAGALLYLPIYRQGSTPQTVEERRQDCVGWIYAPLVIDVVLKDVLGERTTELEFSFFEGRSLDAKDLLYRSTAEPVQRHFDRVTETQLGGKPFTIGWKRTPAFVASDSSAPLWAATSAAIVSVLLAALVLSLQSTGARAQSLARERTAQLEITNRKLELEVGERERAQQAIKQSEERFRTAFESTGIGMAILTLDGRFSQVNRTLCQIVGYTREELLQKTFHQITHPDDLAGDVAQSQALLEGTSNHYQLDKRYIHRDGHSVWIRLTASLVRNEAGQPLQFVKQIEDITSRREMDQKLADARDKALEASRLKSEFLATMSHEIRTPMNGVIGMSNLLMETALNPKQKEMARVIVHSADNLLTIVNDILDFSKIEAGKLRIDAIDFELGDALRESVALHAPSAARKSVGLACEIAPALETKVHGDRGRFQQILNNLIGNAVKFTSRGEVRVIATEISAPTERLGFRIEVRDTGIGIPDSVRPLLFQPFVQADGSTTRKFGGTGLGLAICAQLTRLMGGKIDFRSSEGAGSCFWLELELQRAGPESDEHDKGATFSRQSTVGEKSVPARSLKLLVAEDNPINHLVIQMLMEKVGHSVVFAENGQEALQRLREDSYDAILMDCQMPVMDGYEATRRIRAGEVSAEVAKIPIIALTAYAMPEDRARALAAGMNEHVSKPLELDALDSAFARCGLASAANAGQVAGFGSEVNAVASEAAAPRKSSEIFSRKQRQQLSQIRTRDGLTLWEQAVKRFLQAMPREMDEVHALLDARDAEKLGVAAHSIAGVAANMGAAEMQSAARELERAARSGAWPTIFIGIQKLDAAWREAEEYLKAEVLL